MSYFQPRKSNILGVGDYSYEDNKWIFTLGYANGPGFSDHSRQTGGRVNPRGMAYMNNNFRQPATVPLTSETHSAEDVGVFASGPQSHLFTGVYEQSYIAHAMIYATCLGPQHFTKHPDCSNLANFPRLSILILIISFYSLFHLFHE